MRDGEYNPYESGWSDGYAEGYACKLADVTNPFMPAGTAEEIGRVADWLQTRYAATHGDRDKAIGMARGMIRAARGDWEKRNDDQGEVDDAGRSGGGA